MENRNDNCGFILILSLYWLQYMYISMFFFFFCRELYYPLWMELMQMTSKPAVVVTAVLIYLRSKLVFIHFSEQCFN